MKVITREELKDNKIVSSFVGLATDRDGDLWLFTKSYVIAINEFYSGIECSREEADSSFGPFTKYFGTVTLEND